MLHYGPLSYRALNDSRPRDQHRSPPPRADRTREHQLAFLSILLPLAPQLPGASSGGPSGQPYGPLSYFAYGESYRPSLRRPPPFAWRTRRAWVDAFPAIYSVPLPPAPCTIREAIGYALLASPAITSIVGARVREGRRPMLDQLPELLYHVVSNIRGRNLAGGDGTAAARVQFDCYAWYLPDAVAMSKALFALFDGFHGDLPGVTCRWVWQIDEQDFHEEPMTGQDNPIFRIQTDYRFGYTIPIQRFS